MAVQLAEAELKGVIAAARRAMSARPPASPGDIELEARGREPQRVVAPLPAAPEAAWRPVLRRVPGDLEYVRPDDRVDEDIKCPVCLAWPVDPVLLGCDAAHMLCRACSRGLRRCPLDRQPLAGRAPGAAPARVAERLARLRVRCPHAGGGCAWVGSRGSLLEHCRGECALALYECRLCGAHVRRRELGAHVHSFEAGARVLWTASGDSPAPVGEVVRADAVSDTVVVLFAGGARPCRRGELALARDGAAGAPAEAASTSSSSSSSPRPPSAQRRESRIDSVLDVYERAERLNVCFLVDCTGSMRSHIAAVKNQVLRIVREMSVRFPSMRLHVAFVGYRDHGDLDRFDVLPFTTSVEDFRAFLGGVGAHGCGGDVPEDVLGGLETASRLEWGIGGAATRVLIHIGDAPCHGHRYQDRQTFRHKDNFPQGDPAGLRPLELLRGFQEKKVQYVFGRINSTTDLMVRLFNKEVGEEYIQTREMRDTRLVAEAVTTSLHSSVASTVSALSGGLRAARRVEVCDEAPCWQELEARGVHLHRCLQVSSVADLHQGAPARLTGSFEVDSADVKLGMRPFSQGETRAAHHALVDGREAYVAKFMKDEVGEPGSEEDEWLLEEMLALSEVSAVAAFLAREFSAQNPAGPQVEFLEAYVAVPPTPAAGRPFNLERALPAAEFRRFSNNLGWWEPDADEVLMRFARFTHEATGGYMMVTDLQGVRTAEGGFLLTDPCVLCHDVTRFGGGNMGRRAMERCMASIAARLDASQEPDIVDEFHSLAEQRPAPAQPSGACFPILPCGAAEHEPERLRWSSDPPALEVEATAAPPEQRGAGLLLGAARAVSRAGAPAVGAMVASALGAAGLRSATATAHKASARGAAGSPPGAAALDVDEAIAGLMVPTHLASAAKLPAEAQLRALLAEARGVLLSQPALLELEAPLNVLGDIHGQFKDLLAWLELSGGQQANYLCLGDYVDRGKQSLEVITLLLALKVKRPENVFLLRGNHECASITRIYGFYDECKRRFNIKLWKTFCDVFNCLPAAAVIEDKVFCCHGGPSPELSDLNLVRSIPRPTDVPDSGILCDLLWADPDKDTSGWQENDRGVSFTFGPDVAASFLGRHGLDLIVRAHQVVEDGYEFFAGRRLVTVFSAPNYIGEFDNAGALLEVRSDLQCGFKLLRGRTAARR